MTAGRLLAFCGLGFCIVFAMVYVATHYPAADSASAPRGASGRPAPHALTLQPATSSDRQLEYAPAPAFVEPVSVPDPETADAELYNGARLLLADFQHDATNPQSGLYTRQVMQAVTGAGVAALSQYQVSIDPRYQTIVIHEAVIIRDGARESREGRIAPEFLRQEPHLDAGIMTGMELAVLRIEDVREGDILDLSFSLTGINPLLAPFETRIFPLASLPEIQQLSIRTLWPRGAAHRVAGAGGDDPVVLERRGSRTLFTFPPQRTQALALEDGAPADHLQMPVLMVSSWPDWQSVAAWGRPFYALPAEPDAGVAAIAADIRQAHATPARQLVAALEYVQDEIRYQAILLGDSTYVPASLSETLRTRTGDCKAKTLLLLAILDALEIEAYPVLANTSAGRSLNQYPPSPQVFDHVFVQARLGDNVFWLEPATSGQRGALFSRTRPDYGFVLVMDGHADDLTDMTPDETPLASTVFHESFELMSQLPNAPLVWTVEVTHRGAAADEWRALIGQMGLSQIERAYTAFYADYRSTAELETPLRVDDDEETNTLILNASWRVAPLIGPADVNGRREIRLRPHSLGVMLASTDLERRSPVITAYPLHRRHIIEGGIDVPGGSFWNLEDRSESYANEAFEFSYSQTYENGMLALVYDQRALTPSVMLDEAMVEDHRQMSQRLRSYILTLTLPPLDALEAAETTSSKP